MGLGDSHDPDLLRAVHGALSGSHWPGLLPALKRWLDDPAIPSHALRYALLTRSAEGRELLLAHATTASYPIALRRQAIERLQETIPGIHLLLTAVDEPGAGAVLAASIEGDPRTTFSTALAKLEGRARDAFWSELIEGVDTDYPNNYPNPVGPWEKAASEAEGRIRQQTQATSLRCLRWLTGRTDLRPRPAWQRWYETTRPPPVTPCALAKLVLEHPEALESAAILRRIVPYELGEAPAECVPLYERMAREGPPASRYWACTALLHCTPRTDAAPLVIDLIGLRPLDGGRTGRWGPIELLKVRFAENFFWDVAVWREW